MAIVAASIRAKFDTAYETAFGSITSSFTQIGARSFDVSYKIVFVQNQTDAIMDFSISYAGDSVSFSLVPGGTFSTDITANGGGGVFQTAVGEAAWVKYRTAPSTGFVQFSGVTGV